MNLPKTNRLIHYRKIHTLKRLGAGHGHGLGQWHTPSFLSVVARHTGGRSPWNWHSDFCRLPHDLAEDIDMTWPVSFEIDQHRGLEILHGLRSSNYRTISSMISLTVAFTSSVFGSARSSFMVTRETVHKLEYAAFLSFLSCQRANLVKNPGTYHNTFLQR